MNSIIFGSSNTLSAKSEMKVGSAPLRKFDEGQEVLVRDHCPDTKSMWRRYRILAWLGPLTYKISVDDQTRMAHVDHLLPSSWEEDETVDNEQKHKEEGSDSPASATEIETSRRLSSRITSRLIQEVYNTEH